MKGETLLTQKNSSMFYRDVTERKQQRRNESNNMKVNKEQHEHAKAQRSETVLVLQGGGSLGAYECGVYKTIAWY